MSTGKQRKSLSNFYSSWVDMGKFDKDRQQKELAIRYCLARRAVPYLEVAVHGTSDISESPEVLTDIDVLGLERGAGDSLQKTIIDCKTTNKISPVNRSLWARGLQEYIAASSSIVILKHVSVKSHKVSLLGFGVDIHDAASFIDLGRTFDPAFPADVSYRSTLEKWMLIELGYSRNQWAEGLRELCESFVPLSKLPANTFRRLIAELRAQRGKFDPRKPEHVAIFLEALAACLVLWASMIRDVRRIYDPNLAEPEFEMLLRHYLWGGRDSFALRRQVHERTQSDQTLELPAWDKLKSLVGLFIAAPLAVFDCARYCRELSIRELSGPIPRYDTHINLDINSNTRLRQFSLLMSDYLVSAASLPKEMGKSVETQLLFEQSILPVSS